MVAGAVPEPVPRPAGLLRGPVPGEGRHAHRAGQHEPPYTGVAGGGSLGDQLPSPPY